MDRLIIVRYLHLYVLTFLMTFASSVRPAGTQPLFWEAELAKALDIRDSIYRAAGIDSVMFAAMAHGGTMILPHQAADSSSPWSNFLSGIACVKDSPDCASQRFAQTLNAFEKDPGQTLALAMEFGRCGQGTWEEKSLAKLNILFLMSGAQSAPLISQILLYEGAHPSKEPKIQPSILSWAARFDRNCLWPAILSIKELGIANISKTPSLIREMSVKISSSWGLQLKLARQWYRWLVCVCVFFVFGTLAALAVKYLPQALHSSSERLPGVYRPKTKLVLSCSIYASFFFLGIIPFVWISFFLLWRHLRTRDKTLAGIALALMVLYPIHIRFVDMLESCQAPGGPVMLLRKAIDEGYYPALDSSIAERVKQNGSDYLAHTAAAVIKLKKGDIIEAFPHVRFAQKVSRFDPAVMVTAGNSLYFSGDLAGARNAYLECIKLYPGYEMAYFNLGQYYFNSMETAKGMEYITQAAKLNPVSINAFIKSNDESFSKDWPQLRQLIQPDYSPAFFWKNIFPRYGGSWATADTRFGADCLGLSILTYGAVSLFLLVMLLVLDSLVWSRDTVRKIYTCKLCQTPICRKCKRGGICQDCFNSTQHIRNENIRQRIMAKLQFRSRRFHVVVATALDTLFPGAGMLYAAAPLYATLPVLVATSVVYGSYFVLLFPMLDYPAWLWGRISPPLFAACALYNAFFIGRTVTQVVRELKSRGE
jgi:hypothetical protein